jgi:YfiH family protein
VDGQSKPPFDQNNLGLHVGDESAQVLANRNRLKNNLNLPADPCWLEQTHSDHCVIVENTSNRKADAAITKSPNHVLSIMTADCLPITLCNIEGTEIAAIHAGWKGLAAGIIENTCNQMQSGSQSLMAWIGPAICESCFETGEEVIEIFSKRYSFSKDYFLPKAEKYLGNLPDLAEKILNNLGIKNVFKSNACTFEQKKEFFSYRRESQTGRIATLIWFKTIQDL